MRRLIVWNVSPNTIINTQNPSRKWHDVDMLLPIDLSDLLQLHIVKRTKKKKSKLMRLVSCHAKPVG